MAHHKRGRPKNARSGCLMCKAHKANGVKGMLAHQTRQELLGRLNEGEQRGRIGEDPERARLKDERLALELSWARPPRLENDLLMREKFRQRVVDSQ